MQVDQGVPAVHYWDYLPFVRQHREVLLDITDRVLSSGRLILGSQVASFEAVFSAWCGVSYGVGVNSCTDALFFALKALGIGGGDEVITVANTAVPTVAAIRAAGATPVFTDVEPDTCLMDVTQLGGCITQRTRCILPVHLFGQSVEMAPLLKLAADRNLAVIEDCAQAAGALYAGKRVGSFGDIGAFSFYPTKILGGFGDGGMAVTTRDDLRDKLRRLRMYGMEGSYCSLEEGYNSRLDELQAALLEYRLQSVDNEVRRRREIAGQYNAALSGVGDLVLPAEREGNTHQYYLYTVRSRYRDALRAFLGARGIETRINYPVPVHLMDGYRFLGYNVGDLPVTEQLAGEIISLPMHPWLSSDDLERVITEVGSFFSSAESRST